MDIDLFHRELIP